MKRRAVVGIIAFGAGLVSVSFAGRADAGPVDRVPPVCLVVSNSGVNLQLGYCPNGPDDGIPLP